LELWKASIVENFSANSFVYAFHVFAKDLIALRENFLSYFCKQTTSPEMKKGIDLIKINALL